MSAVLHTLARSPSERRSALRVSLASGGGAHVVAVVRAYLPPPAVVEVRCPNPDVALVWWAGPGTVVEAAAAGVPLVAVCAGGPEVLAAALDAGADYALALPTSAALLGSVCRAYARRAPAPLAARRAAATAGGALHLDRRARTLTVHGQPVHLTLREFSLLSDLVAHAGAACSRGDLLERVWGIAFETGTNTVDVFVYALRQKLRAAGLRGAIQTVRGVGYRLDASLL